MAWSSNRPDIHHHVYPSLCEVVDCTSRIRAIEIHGRQDTQIWPTKRSCTYKVDGGRLTPVIRHIPSTLGKAPAQGTSAQIISSFQEPKA